MIRVLSLGAGVQSTTVLLMSIRGELEKLDAVIFADTGWEPKAVYAHLERLKTEMDKASVPFYIVRAGNIRSDALRAYLRKEQYSQVEGGRWANIPYYTRNPDGTVGVVRRQCTTEYKVEPIERKIRELLGIPPRKRWPAEPVVEQWFGISAEEQRRLRMPDARWKTHRYPLVFDKPMKRHDCLLWLQEHWPYPVPRSSCLGCPFHSNTEWRNIRDNEPDEWADVVEFDEAIRHHGGDAGDLYLHRSCQPLVQIDLSTPEERGQLAMNWREECLGYCGT